MQEAYFTSIGNNIINELNKAQSTVHVAMAWFTNDALFESLLDCVKRGVKVELILLDDVINWQPYAPDFSQLIKEKAFVYIAKRTIGFMHHKFCIIDNSLTITGSYNWTYYAETRNIENVIITDDNIIAKYYEQEFVRLKSNLSKAESCPKYDKETIEQIDNVDYDILNYEIEKAAEVKHLIERPVFETHTHVKIVEKRKNPISKYNIGVKAESGNDIDVMGVIFPAGISLPNTKSCDFTAYADEQDSICCDLLYGLSPKASENEELKTRPLKDITKGCTTDSFNIHIAITLNPNGYLLAEISCDETNKVIELDSTNLLLVDYE